MPRVPVYGESNVAPKPLGAPRTDTAGPRDVANSPDFFGGVAAKQQTALGESASRSGSQFAVIAVKVQERENAERVNREDTVLKEQYLKAEQEWREKRRGHFAENLVDDATDWWDKAIRERTDSLKNPAQQRAFQERAQRIRETSIRSVAGFQATELDRAHDESLEASKNLSISLATQNPEFRGTAKTEIKEGIIKQGARKGWSGDRIEAEILKDYTRMHENIIRGMATTDPAGAAQYFNDNKKEIHGERHDELGKFARDVSGAALGGEIGAGVWTKMGPKHLNDPVDRAAMEEAVREAAKGNPIAEKAGLTAVQERTLAHNASQVEYVAARGSAVSKAIMGGASASQVMQMPEFLELPGDKQLQFTKYIDDQKYIQEQRVKQAKREAEAEVDRRENKAYQKMVREDMMERRKERQIDRDSKAEYFRLSDPAVYGKMSRKELEMKLPDLGPDNLQRLLEKHDSLQKSTDKVHAATIDRESLFSVMRSVGMDPDTKEDRSTPKGANHYARLGEAEVNVEDAIAIAQKGKPQPLEREEKEKIARSVLSKQVLRDPGFFSWNRSGEPIPAAAVTPKDLERIKVPKENRERIIASWKANPNTKDQPLTEEQIKRFYVRGQLR